MRLLSSLSCPRPESDDGEPVVSLGCLESAGTLPHGPTGWLRSPFVGPPSGRPAGPAPFFDLPCPSAARLVRFPFRPFWRLRRFPPPGKAFPTPCAVRRLAARPSTTLEGRGWQPKEGSATLGVFFSRCVFFASEDLQSRLPRRRPPPLASGLLSTADSGSGRTAGARGGLPPVLEKKRGRGEGRGTRRLPG